MEHIRITNDLSNGRRLAPEDAARVQQAGLHYVYNDLRMALFLALSMLFFISLSAIFSVAMTGYFIVALVLSFVLLIANLIFAYFRVRRLSLGTYGHAKQDVREVGEYLIKHG